MSENTLPDRPETQSSPPPEGTEPAGRPAQISGESAQTSEGCAPEQEGAGSSPLEAVSDSTSSEDDAEESSAPAREEVGLVHRWTNSQAVDRYRSSMHVRLGLLVRWLLVPFFSWVRFSDQAEERVREVAREGTPVYIMRTVSLLSFLYLNFILIVRGLPLARFTNEIYSPPWGPWRSGLRPIVAKVLRHRSEGRLPDPVASGYLTQLVRDEHPAFLFLRERRSALRDPGRKPAQTAMMTALITAQRQSSKPIILLPQALVWEQKRARAQKTLLDVLLGDREDPGPIRQLGRFLRNHRRASLVVGEPLNLRDFIERAGAEQTDEVLGRKLRLLMLMYLGREMRAVQSPNVKPRGLLLERIFSDQDVQEAISIETKKHNRMQPEVEKQVRGYLRRISADISMSLIDIADYILKRVWSRIYDGVVVDPNEIERLRVISHRATVVLVPCHRSHVDYLLLSWVLHNNNLAVPYIAAGKNLSFWPLGPLFRRMGAFFVQGSFLDDPLRPVLTRKYIRGLLQEGHTLEFFIEGGRSRSGRLLQPKVEFLSMIADYAATSHSHQDIVLVPVSISYEKVVEAREYLAEVEGAEKDPGTVGGVFRTEKRAFYRQGKVRVGFLEPVSLKETLRDAPRVYTEDMPWPEKKAFLEPLGLKLLNRIAHSTPLTATQLVATAILNHSRRGILEHVLKARVERLRELFLLADVPCLPDDGASFARGLDQVLAFLVQEAYIVDYRDSERRIFAINEAKRLDLDYFKSAAITPIVPEGILACIVVSLSPGPLSRDVLQDHFNFLSDLWCREFVFDPEMSREEVLDGAVTRLEAAGILEYIPAGATMGDDSEEDVAREGAGVEVAATTVDEVEPTALPDADGEVEPAALPEEGTGEVAAEPFTDDSRSLIVPNALSCLSGEGRPANARGDGPQAPIKATLVGQADLAELRGLLYAYLEAYSVVLRTIGSLRYERVRKKALLNKVLEQAQAMYMTEEIQRKEATAPVILESAFMRYFEMGLMVEVDSSSKSDEDGAPLLSLNERPWRSLRHRLSVFLEEYR